MRSTAFTLDSVTITSRLLRSFSNIQSIYMFRSWFSLINNKWSFLVDAISSLETWYCMRIKRKIESSKETLNRTTASFPWHSETETPRWQRTRDTLHLVLKCNRPREPYVFVALSTRCILGKRYLAGWTPDPLGGNHLHVPEWRRESPNRIVSVALFVRKGRIKGFKLFLGRNREDTPFSAMSFYILRLLH